MWYWPGLNRANLDPNACYISYMTSEALCDPSSSQGANRHFACKERVALTDPFAVTVIIPTNTNDVIASELPVFKQRTTPIRNYERPSVGLSYRKGLHSEKALLGNKRDILDILVTPLDDLTLDGGRGGIRMSVSCEELKVKSPPSPIEMDMDEATGRVVIWGWDRVAAETKIFVGDLV